MRFTVHELPPDGEITVYVPSSRGDRKYLVWRHADGRWTCECQDFFYRCETAPGYECKHIRKVRIDLILDEELPRYAEALQKLGKQSE